MASMSTEKILLDFRIAKAAFFWFMQCESLTALPLTDEYF